MTITAPVQHDPSTEVFEVPLPGVIYTLDEDYLCGECGMGAVGAAEPLTFAEVAEWETQNALTTDIGPITCRGKHLEAVRDGDAITTRPVEKEH